MEVLLQVIMDLDDSHMFLGPVLIEMGVLPQVAVATSSYMILFTSSSTVVQFVILGNIGEYD